MLIFSKISNNFVQHDSQTILEYRSNIEMRYQEKLFLHFDQKWNNTPLILYW